VAHDGAEQGDYVARAGDVLANDLELTRADRAEGLRLAHAKYTQMFLSDNARIWTTAATMIPLSLGGFVVLVSIQKPSVFQVGALAVASWVLMALWYVIAENHRAFQTISLQQITKIEALWGIAPTPQKKERAGMLTGAGGVRRTRIALLWLVTLGWIAVLLWWPSTYLYGDVEKLWLR
jgi:hypothetical protein